MKPKVLIIHSPFNNLEFGDKWKEAESLVPPPGLMYLGYPLIKRGWDVSFIDLNIDRFTKKEFVNTLKDKDIIGLSCYSGSLENVVKIIIPLIRKVTKKVKILCGGPYCNLSRNMVSGSDITLVGEAETCIDEIISNVLKKKSLEKYPGLIYKENGKIIKNSGFLEVKNLDDSKHATFELSNGKNYGYYLGSKIKNVTGIMSTRGCSFQCTYCTHKGIFKYRERSVENVIEELKDLQKREFKYVVFFDDNFLLNKKRANQILDRIIEERIKLKFFIQGRADSADYTFYKKLKKAGVIMILFGVENANQDVLDFYKKGILVEEIKKAIYLCNKAGLITFGYFIFGAPMEDKKHFEVNKEFIKKMPLDYVNINILGYYQGSELWNMAVKKKWINEKQTIYYADEKVSPHSFEEWKRMKEEALQSFYTFKRKIRFTLKLLDLICF